MKPLLLVPLALVTSLLPMWPGDAVAVGGAVPPGCVAHTTFSDGADVSGDYRCAGMAIDFHTAGAAVSPFPLWAGQWLFVDPDGRYRKGTCTFNRGTHPTVLSPSRPVAQSFPNDPTGAKGAYLAWRYGDTTDPLVAAGLWAVFHHYALDAAGSNRSADPAAPLVPRLGGIAAATGRADLQARAIALDAEARAMAGEWHLSVQLVPDDDGSATVQVVLLAGDHPVPGRPVAVLVSGDDVSRSATTGTDGRATVTVPIPSGMVTVAATTEAPGPVEVYRGSPAAPNPLGAQTLAVAGTPRTLQATASVDVPPATTTTTTTAAPTTTEPPTTTAPPATEAPTTAPSTTVPATTAPIATAPATTTTVTPTIPTTTAPAPRPPLPTTGRGGDGGIAQLATAFLVGGIGLLGTLRRRPAHPRGVS